MRADSLNELFDFAEIPAIATVIAVAVVIDNNLDIKEQIATGSKRLFFPFFFSSFKVKVSSSSAQRVSRANLKAMKSLLSWRRTWM